MNAHATIFGNAPASPANGEMTKAADDTRTGQAIERHGDIHRRVIEACDEAIRVIGCNADMAIRGYEADLEEARSAFEKERERLSRLIRSTRADTDGKLAEQKRLRSASESALAVLSAPAAASKSTAA